MESIFKSDVLDVVVPSTLTVSPIIIITAVVLIFSWALGRSLGGQKLPFPVLNKGKEDDWTSVIAKGVEKYRDTGFIVPQPNEERVILPIEFLEEIKNTPASIISFTEQSHEIMASHYTKVGIDDRHHNMREVIKVDLTQNIGNMLPEIQDEVRYSFDTEIGSCKDWTETYPFAKLLEIIALVSGRAFVGLPLCRDRAWRDINIHYTIDAFAAAKAVKKHHPWLRSFWTLFVPELYKIRGYEKYVASKMRPLIRSILDARQENGKAPKGSNTDHNIAHWYINRVEDPREITLENMTRFELGVGLAAIHTTSLTVTNAIYDLAAHPEIVPELRTEIETVIAEDNLSDGIFQKSSMPKLKKLDSFIKESQRMNPLGAFVMMRKVSAPEGFTLSDGRHFPQGTRIGFAHTSNPRTPLDPNSSLMQMSSASEPLNEFHAFRFANIRSLPGEGSKHQFVTTSRDSLSFGHGSHACPGRFFAGNEIKMILIELLKRYDVALGPQGQGVAEGFTRPTTFEDVSSYVPDPRAKIYLKNRL